MTFAKLHSYSIGVDGRIELRTNKMPAIVVASSPPVSVTVPQGTDFRLVCRLLRQLADELGGQEAEIVFAKSGS